MILDAALLLLFPAAMAMAGAMDLFTMTIPNRISLALVAGFFVLAPFAGLGVAEMATHFATGLAMLVVGIFFFSRGWIGGGDAKLFAAAALWIGYEQLLLYAVAATLLGGGLTLAFLFLRMLPVPAVLTRQDWLMRLHDSKQGIPYGIALAAAGLLVYPQTVWMSGIAV
ncbi:MAG: A24 family peptidase [Methyloligellaceae bacterium]